MSWVCAELCYTESNLVAEGYIDEDRVQDGRWTEKGRSPGGTVKPMKEFQACEVSGCELWEIEIWREQKAHTNEEGNAVREES